jgi:Ca2+-binding RTX toxin-like protein
MSDFASLIGGSGDTIPIGQADPDLAFYYEVNSPGGGFFDLGALGDVFNSSGSTGNVTVFAGTGDDTATGGVGNDVFNMGAGDDSVNAGDGNNTVSGGLGEDTIFTGSGNDFVDGGAGDDNIQTGDGNDRAFGGDGDDLIAGGGGNDTIAGGTGDDNIAGGSGNDVLLGGSGNDFIVGGSGNDLMFGGTGDDTFFFDSNFGNDVIGDWNPGDEVWLASDINGSGIADASDVLPFVSSGGANVTLIQIGGDTIRIEGIDASVFTANINSIVRIV